MFRKLILVVFCLLLCSATFAGQTPVVVNFDVSGQQARHTFNNIIAGATALQPLAIPSGAKFAGLVIKSGTWDFSGGDVISGPIRNASFFINLSQSSSILNNVSGRPTGVIPNYTHNIASVTAESSDHFIQQASFVQNAFSSPGIWRYGSYKIPVQGYRFMQIMLHQDGAITATASDATKTVIIDFND